MADNSQRPKGRDSVLSSLNVAIDGLNLAKGATSVLQAKAAFTSASFLLTMIRVGFLSAHVGQLLANVQCRTR